MFQQMILILPYIPLYPICMYHIYVYYIYTTFTYIPHINTHIYYMIEHMLYVPCVIMYVCIAYKEDEIQKRK